MSLRDISEALRDEGVAIVSKRDLSQLLERIEELEVRLDAASKVVRTALGNAGIDFLCAGCNKFAKMRYDEEKRVWVCGNCGKKPF